MFRSLRRTWLIALVGALVVLLVSGCATTKPVETPAPQPSAPSAPTTPEPPAPAPKELTVRVGRLSWAVGNSYVSEYMKQNKLFEKHAAELGYSLKVDYSDWAAAGPMVEAVSAGQIDIGAWGSTPMIRALAQDMPVNIIAVGEGRQNFALAVRPGSPIRNLDDLKGKTIGTLLGGDPHNFLLQVLKAKFGTTDAQSLGIKIVSLATPAQQANIPPGVDVTTVPAAAFLECESKGICAGLINARGLTEDHYSGADGSGPDRRLAEADKSPYAPEGFYAQRVFWVSARKFASEHPKVITAFVAAANQAIRELKTTMTPADVSQLVAEWWKLSPELGAKMVANDLVWDRGWLWVTDADVNNIVETSKVMAETTLIDKALTREQILNNLRLTNSPITEAYAKVGNFPASEEFQRKVYGDSRGNPSWELSR
jgi:ABC-type nitrate/sulfonate/bicarbonate transport system substrate-binding protein